MLRQIQLQNLSFASSNASLVIVVKFEYANQIFDYRKRIAGPRSSKFERDEEREGKVGGGGGARS